MEGTTVAEQQQLVHKAGLAMLPAALLLGVLGAWLLRPIPWGFGFSIFTVAACLVTFLLAKKSLAPVNRRSLGLLPVIALFGLLFSWRDALELRLANGLLIALLIGIVALRIRPGALSHATISDYPFKAVGTWFTAIWSSLLLIFEDIRWKELSKNSAAGTMGSTLRGVLLAIPIVLIFGGLFASADANFERFIDGMFQFDVEELYYNGAATAVVGFFAAGFFRKMYIDYVHPKPLVPPPVEMPSARPSKPARLGSIELAIILGSLNLLFALFVATQFRYFFGGISVVQSTDGLVLSEFARRGFFELAWVAGLVLPTLLGLHALMDPENRASDRLYRVLSAILIVLLLVVIHSASLKMKLYMDSFGLSTTRVYVCASLVWLLFVFGWFCFTVLRGKVDRFAWGGVVSLMVCVLGVNIANPEAMVARWNLTKQAPNAIDWDYLLQLGSDAAPILRQNLSKVPPGKLEQVKAALDWEQEGIQERDWRRMNLAELSLRR